MEFTFKNPSSGENQNYLYQWDTDIELSFSAPHADETEAVFSVAFSKEGIRRTCEKVSGLWKCTIPDKLLEYGKNILVFVTITTDGRKTVDHGVIPVVRQAKPEGYISKDKPEYITFDEMTNTLTESKKTAQAAAKEAADLLAQAEVIKTAAKTATDAAAAAEKSSKDASDAVNGFENVVEKAKTDTLTAINQKAEQITKITTDADQVAKQALEKAGNAENEAAETANKLDSVDKRIDEVILKLQSKFDDAYLENGFQYFTADGSVICGPLGPFAGGGGSGDTNKAVLTVTNTTGWLSKTISSGADCKISFVWSSIEDDMPTGNGTVRVTNNGSIRMTKEIQQGNVTVDLGDYVSTGSNVVKVQASDIYGNARTINFSVTVIALSVSSTFDVSAPFTGAISFPYTPVGAVQKTVHFILDGKEIGTQQTSVSGRQMTYTIPSQSHGAHTFHCYFEAEINGETVLSNELYYEFIAVESLNDTVIITSSYNQTTQPQYASIQIPYTVYDPGSLTAEVMLYANGNHLSTQTVDRTEQSYTYRANDAGEVVFEIRSGGTVKSIRITVIESDIHVEAETENLTLYFTSQGRSNQEEHPEIWKSGSISAVLSGFNWASDGWQKDGEGITVMRIAGDARITIPYQPFASDFRGTGKTIEIEFATRDVLDYDAEILSCMSGGRGISITAQKAALKSEQSEISTQYKEDEHVRIAFVAEKRAENRLLFIYINGIASGVVQYPEDDDFSQLSPVGINIGSGFCTMDIYCIRIYDNDLTRFQIVDNWIADSQIGSEMLERYTRNNVFDAYGNIVISQLPPDLPYLIQTATELPQYKGDKKTVSGSYTDPAYPSKSFTFEGAQSDVQGTSSQYYARKNYKIKFKEGFTMKGGSKAGKYAINPEAVPVSTFTYKADVASSEGANNVELARLYNETCPYKTPAQKENAKIRQGIDGFPIVMFWNDGENTSFLGKYNFNNDKGTEEVFGFSSPDESWEIRNNTGNRVLWKSDDYESTVTDENGKTTKAWLNDFEARYPDLDPAYEDATQLKEFAVWAKSTDTAQATGKALSTPVTYGEGENAVTYTNDTAAYRLAKFRAEAEKFMELQSALFYYLFTELFLMVDSRAKNAFPSFIGSEVEE